MRALIDKNRKRFGQFILLGSASFSLQKNINESLSGRVGFLDFNPFHINEVHSKFSLNSFWLKGGFPDALINEDTNTLNFEWFEFYTRTLIERDLPSLGIDINQRQFRLLWKMATHFHGEVLNKNKIATSLGVSPHMVDRYLFILEQTFTLRLLPPYFANIKKRLIKSPKLYFRDSGMFHYFTELKTYENLISSPQLGSSFEGLVIEQIFQLLPLDWKPYFFRTSDGIEIDLVLASGNKLVPIEIKSKLSASKKDYASLEKVLKILNQPKGFLITLGDDSYPLSEKVECIGIHHWANNSCYSFWEKK